MIRYVEEMFHIYAEQSAKNNNVYCGDSYYITNDDKELVCILADGLGSGEFAYESSQAAIQVVKNDPKASIETLMDRCNSVMLGKRGAAVAIFKVDFSSRTLEYSCVGNIRFFLFPPDEKSVYPMPVSGFLSGRRQQYRIHRYSYKPSTKFLLYTDGFIPHQTNALMKELPITDELIAHINTQQSNEHDDITFIIGSFF